MRNTAFAINMRLSSLHARKTAQILKPEYLNYSPCIGLLLSTAPNIIANLRQLNIPSTELARELFHQRSSAYEGGAYLCKRRYGPLGISKSRSNAAFWLSPQGMGAMIGLAKSTVDMKVPSCVMLLHISSPTKSSFFICCFFI